MRYSVVVTMMIMITLVGAVVVTVSAGAAGRQAAAVTAVTDSVAVRVLQLVAAKLQ